MKKLLLVLFAVVALSGCSGGNTGSYSTYSSARLSVNGMNASCIGGVVYYVLMKRMAVAHYPDGSVINCESAPASATQVIKRTVEVN